MITIKLCQDRCQVVQRPRYNEQPVVKTEACRKVPLLPQDPTSSRSVDLVQRRIPGILGDVEVPNSVQMTENYHNSREVSWDSRRNDCILIQVKTISQAMACSTPNVSHHQELMILSPPWLRRLRRIEISKFLSAEERLIALHALSIFAE
jgi:hypothetical protein